MGLASSTTKSSLFFIYSHPILFGADSSLLFEILSISVPVYFDLNSLPIIFNLFCYEIFTKPSLYKIMGRHT